MNLFQDLEGLSGEVLGSAALRHLILRSMPLRDEALSKTALFAFSRLY